MAKIDIEKLIKRQEALEEEKVKIKKKEAELENKNDNLIKNYLNQNGITNVVILDKYMNMIDILKEYKISNDIELIELLEKLPVEQKNNERNEENDFEEDSKKQ